MDKVLDAYKKLVLAVGYVNCSAVQGFDNGDQLGAVYDALDKLAALYGMDLELAATGLKESNDIQQHVEKLRGDDLIAVRIVGTLCTNLSTIGACIYDVDQSLRTPEAIGDMLSTILVLSEFEGA
ncbi:hypothetical protein A1c_00010 [Klebsiella phage VLCpiA1c]|nr:hypothetical protein A1c_00010 [Klebsiella phage VLCpiA1c]